MEHENLINLITSLSSEQQAAVEKFIRFLQDKRDLSDLNFQTALESFVREHPELLHRLSQ